MRKWIMSEGGALIAVDSGLKPSWGGICKLTVPTQKAKNDYERIPERLDYIQAINLRCGEALIFGEGPLNTTIWQSHDTRFFVVRMIYCEPDFAVDDIMHNTSLMSLGKPDEEMRFEFFSDQVTIFDSADDGSRKDVDCLHADIKPGRYEILTKLCKPDDLTCFIIHKFDKIN